MRTLFFAILFVFGVFDIFAQPAETTSLTLRECIEQAIERNINTIGARIEEEKSHHRVAESRSALLPQIDIGGSFLNNIKLPTTMLPGVIIGQPGTNIPVQIGSRYNTTTAVSVNQVLYNQTALASLKISKHSEELSRLGVEKANENLAHEIAKLYFITQTTAEQKTLIEENISRTRRMTDITKLLLDNGMGKQVDYDRINVTLQNLYTQLGNTDALHQQQLNMMKYMLDIPVDENIILTDTVSMPLLFAEPLAMDDFSLHVEIRMLESQKEIARLTYKRINSGYMPTVSFTGQFSYQGLRSDFSDYFTGSDENRWKSSSFIGLNISIPIFDGFNKRSRSRYAKLDYNHSERVVNNTRDRFQAEYRNAVNSYYNHRSNVERQQQNIELAKKVYTETSLKYREGLSSMSDLLQDEIALDNAQAGFLNALCSFKEAELQIMLLNGEIKRIINP